MSGPVVTGDPDDPFGDKAFLAAKRGKAGAAGGAGAGGVDPAMAGLRAALDAVSEVDPQAAGAIEAVLDDAGLDPFDADGDEVRGGGGRRGSGGGGGSGGGSGGGGGSRDDAQRWNGLTIPRVNSQTREVYIGPNRVLSDCPVKPLGVDRDCAWFLSPSGQLMDVAVRGFGQGELEHLFGTEQDYLIDNWPQTKARRDPDSGNIHYSINGFHAQYARQALIRAAHQQGLFDESDKVRGRGCWLADDGGLVQHLGDLVLVSGKPHKPGVIDGRVYPARPPVPRPTEGTGEQMAGLLARWSGLSWERGERDARLALGFLGSAVLSAALEWRPMIFILGDAASGKSTLQREMRALLTERIKGTVDASEAALRGLMQRDAIAVSFDEIEADNDDGGKASRVMKLARYAASGDSAFRSSADQKVKEYKLMGGMAFSAINVPAMRAQDKQRFCFLRIESPPDGRQAYVKLGVAEATALGQVIAGRMTGQWHRWGATLDTFRAMLLQKGHTSRGADQFGTLLAAADLLLHDELDSERIMNVADSYPRGELIEYEDLESNFSLYWRRLLGAVPDVWRASGLATVGEVLGWWWSVHGPDAGFDPDVDAHARATKAAGMLQRAGLAVIKDRQGGQLWLAVPNDHERTRALFRDTDLARGGWQQALRAGKKWDGLGNPDGLWRVSQVVIDGVRAQATLVRLTGSHTDQNNEARPVFEPRGGGDDQH